MLEGCFQWLSIHSVICSRFSAVKCSAHSSLGRGITVPVVPGLMCINAFGGFKKMTGFCFTRVPSALMAKLEEIQVRPPSRVYVG